MPASGAKGSCMQGENGQAAVEPTAQSIVAADVTDEPHDKPHAQPLLTQVLVPTEQVPRTASLEAGSFSEAHVTTLAARGCPPLIPPARQLHGRARPAAPRGRAGVRAEQAGPRLPAILAARAAARARGVGADLHDAPCAHALDRAASAAPTPTEWTTGADRNPEGRAESPGVAGCRRAAQSAEERTLNPPPRTWCAHFNVGQAPSVVSHA
jgi:hypothetical protein